MDLFFMIQKGVRLGSPLFFLRFLILYSAIPTNIFGVLLIFILSYFPSCAKSCARYKVPGRELF